ncbi:transcription elongation factor S-II [Cryptococcus deuterogattii 99/473]|uniref:Transcription elongation factor n=1 Tax=Cryptococcus deuterogattii Ram5 TaxID=1296110 RepID=A0A0D0V1G4_9TREE|nr:transcription elongation factor S-II [Cryptococcus deuterogattii LA55]KIR40329.1 transcription elongation factor S-II [Cryptococcus deuterogattii Ram5]KIR93602.1 transcription elongation factor S-II [Cryptococcus deuterogattii CBS 10090]KIR99870.1 transcription elongation factor S-II [Cryptococcus deuterogattii 2001/935-1]KIY58570.1 transcription elongation factor S-II [Cryptococcus deuterogattii 99/473]
MDATTLTGHVKELNAANQAGKSDEVVSLLKKLQAEVVPTEDLLRSSKAGVAVGKLRTHATPSVSSLAKEIVKKWRDAVEESKKKRKRAEGDEGKDVKKEKEEGNGKRVKAETGSSAATPSASTPASVSTPDVKATSPPARQPLSTIDSSRTTPRTAKSDGVADSLKADSSEGGSVDSVRDKCVVMIYDALALDSTAERAVGIERAANKSMNFSTGNDYRAKMRSLFLNLKDKGNPALRNEIVLGYISTEKVASMSKDEMASESVRMLKEKIASDNLFKAKAVGVTQAETDAFKCGRCHQRKCTYYQMQTRSADEPMTTFVTCTNCNNRWKFS